MACSKQADYLAELKEGLPSLSESKLAPISTSTIQLFLPKYTYAFENKRDPFTPLVGSGGASMNSDQPIDIQNNIANLELRGIIKDKTGKIALILATDGEYYTLRAGKIYSKRNHWIQGIKGVIKEKSVVLTSRDKSVKELPLITSDSTLP